MSRRRGLDLQVPPALRPLAPFGPAIAIIVLQLVVFPVGIGPWLLGVVVGMLTALVALGMALIYRANRILNFAQGDLGRRAHHAGRRPHRRLAACLPARARSSGWPPRSLLGAVVELVIIRRFFRAPRLLLTVATIGLSQLLIVCGLLLPRAVGRGQSSPTARMPRARSRPGSRSAARSSAARDRWRWSWRRWCWSGWRSSSAAPTSASPSGPAPSAPTGPRCSASRSGGSRRWCGRMAAALSFVGVFLQVVDLRRTAGAGALSPRALVFALAALVLGRLDNLPAVTASAVALRILDQGVAANNPSDAGPHLLGPAAVLLVVLVAPPGSAPPRATSTASSLARGRRGPAGPRRAPPPADRPLDARGRCRPSAGGRRPPRCRWCSQPEQRAQGVHRRGLRHHHPVDRRAHRLGRSGVARPDVVRRRRRGRGRGGHRRRGASTSAWRSSSPASPARWWRWSSACRRCGCPGLFLAVTTLAFSLACSQLPAEPQGADLDPAGRVERPAAVPARSTSPAQAAMYEFVLGVVVLGVPRGARASAAAAPAGCCSPCATTSGARRPTASPCCGPSSPAFALSGFLAAVAGCLLVHVQPGATPSSPFVAAESFGVFTAAVVGGLGLAAGRRARRAVPQRRHLVPARATGAAPVGRRRAASCCWSCPAASATCLYRGRDALLRARRPPAGHRASPAWWPTTAGDDAPDAIKVAMPDRPDGVGRRRADEPSRPTRPMTAPAGERAPPPSAAPTAGAVAAAAPRGWAPPAGTRCSSCSASTWPTSSTAARSPSCCPRSATHFGLDNTGILGVVALAARGPAAHRARSPTWPTARNRVRIALIGAAVWAVFSLGTGLAHRLGAHRRCARARPSARPSCSPPTTRCSPTTTRSPAGPGCTPSTARPTRRHHHRPAGRRRAGHGRSTGGRRSSSSPSPRHPASSSACACATRAAATSSARRADLGVDTVASRSRRRRSPRRMRMVWTIHSLRRIFIALPFLAASIVGLRLAGRRSSTPRRSASTEVERALGQRAGAARRAGRPDLGARLTTRRFAQGPAAGLPRAGRAPRSSPRCSAVGVRPGAQRRAWPSSPTPCIGRHPRDRRARACSPRCRWPSRPGPARSGFSIGALFVLPGPGHHPARRLGRRHLRASAGACWSCRRCSWSAAWSSPRSARSSTTTSPGVDRRRRPGRDAHDRRRGQAAAAIVRDLDVSYGDVQVLFGVDFEVDEGEIVALLGTNGAGKSTLLKAISGVVEADRGAVVFDGRDITHAPPEEIAAARHRPGARRPGRVPVAHRRPRTCGWPGGCCARDRGARVGAGRARRSSCSRSCASALDDPAANLSGGQQQMLALGMAFLVRAQAAGDRRAVARPGAGGRRAAARRRARPSATRAPRSSWSSSR